MHETTLVCTVMRNVRCIRSGTSRMCGPLTGFRTAEVIDAQQLVIPSSQQTITVLRSKHIQKPFIHFSAWNRSTLLKTLLERFHIQMQMLYWPGWNWQSSQYVYVPVWGPRLRSLHPTPFWKPHKWHLQKWRRGFIIWKVYCRFLLVVSTEKTQSCQSHAPYEAWPVTMKLECSLFMSHLVVHAMNLIFRLDQYDHVSF